MNGVSANNRPLSDSINAPDSVMKSGPVMGPENKQFSSSDNAPQTAISSTNATADSSSWMSPVTSLFTPNANQSAQPDKNGDDDDSWMPPMKDDGNNDNDFAPEPPLPVADTDQDMGANEGNKSMMSPLTNGSGCPLTCVATKSVGGRLLMRYSEPGSVRGWFLKNLGW